MDPYIVAVGGDFFPGYRMLVPLAVPAAFIAALGVQALRGARLAPRIGAIGVALLGVYGALQLRDPQIARAHEEGWVWDGRAIALDLGRGFGAARPTIAVVSASVLPYWSNLPAIDMLGLNDAEMWRHASPEFGRAGSATSSATPDRCSPVDPI